MKNITVYARSGDQNSSLTVMMSLIVIGDWGADYLDELLVSHGAVGLDVGLAEDFVDCNERKGN